MIQQRMPSFRKVSLASSANALLGKFLTLTSGMVGTLGAIIGAVVALLPTAVAARANRLDPDGPRAQLP